MSTQADRIIEKFGTQEALAAAIGVGQPAVAAWKKRGFIPSRQQQTILDAARDKGIPLQPADFFDASTNQNSTPTNDHQGSAA